MLKHTGSTRFIFQINPAHPRLHFPSYIFCVYHPGPTCLANTIDSAQPTYAGFTPGLRAMALGSPAARAGPRAACRVSTRNIRGLWSWWMNRCPTSYQFFTSRRKFGVTHPLTLHTSPGTSVQVLGWMRRSPTPVFWARVRFPKV